MPPTILVMYSNSLPTQGHLDRLSEIAPGHSVVAVTDEGVARRHAADCEIILGHRYLWQTLPGAHRLRWVQSEAGGPHHLITPDLLQQAPILTRCPIFSDDIARHALALLLALERQIPHAALNQRLGRPSRDLPYPRQVRRAMVLGLGEIGCAVAEVLRRNRIHVIGMARHRTDRRTAACDEFVGPDEWRDRLPECDACILCLPGTPATTGLFDASAMLALPARSILVNVGHGGTVEMATLVEQLTRGRLGGASLDDLVPWPALPDDPIWRCPGLLITPKIGGFSMERQPRLEQFVEEQLLRFISQEPLLHRMNLATALD